MPGYRLVALDLDGTLLNAESHVPEYASKRILELMDDGVIIMLDTGRMTNTVYELTMQIEPRVAFISYNGAAIVHNGFEIHRFIEPEVIRKVASFCKRYNLYMQTYGPMSICALEPCKELLRDPDLEHSKFVKVDDFEQYDGYATPKILCVRFDDDADEIRTKMQSEFPDLNITKSDPEVIEITAKGVDKASSLAMFCESKGIPREETVAIGNSMNDLPMIEWAGVGVAVGNADQGLKDRADVVTEATLTDGVLEAINRLFPPHV